MLQDDSMNVVIVTLLPTSSEIGMWDGMEQPEALCLACLGCYGLMLCGQPAGCGYCTRVQ